MDTYYFKNVTVVCFSILLFSSYLMGERNDTKIFLEKYGNTEIKVNPKEFIFKERDPLDIQLTKEVNSSTAKKFINSISDVVYDSNEAKEAVNKLQSETMLRNIQSAKKFILDDLDMNLTEYSIKSNASNEDIFSREKMFLCISSSMPKELIRNYLEQIEDHNINVEVVINGFIGGIKKVKKTIAFINSILMKNDKEAYSVKVQINPKIFMNYDISRVPALVYDPNFEKELLEQKKYKSKNNKNTVVVYGAMSIAAMLKKIEENK